VIAMFAVTGAGVGDFEGDDDGAVGEPVQRPSPDNPEGFPERNLTQTAMLA
jgi:hypothetical protein